jgi:signal transduction histidine kinase
MLPYRDARGNFSGILCGIIYFYNTQINEFLKSNTTIIKNNLLYLLDTSGNILQKPFVQDKMLSTTTLINTLKKNLNKNTSGTFKAKNSFSHICSYASLQYAPWIVLSCQDSTIVYAPIKYLVNLFIIITILYILTGLIFATGLSKGIIAPVRALIDETKNIAAGNLSKALVIRGGYEIEELAESFENMRKKLKTSIEHIQSYNEQLEDMVSERTKEVEKNRKKIESLLGLIMTSQEEERKRIARELHDEPLQNLSVILMQLTQFKQLKNKPTDDQINNLLNLLLKINHDIRLIIQNLRPTVLDDLGLISAIRWILENHLRPYNIDYYFDYDNNLEDVRFNSIIEINIYRIIQEAVSNICKHSQAQNVHIKFIVKKQKIIINIIDNGIGFDVNKVLNKDVSIKTDLKGIGLLGMYERVALLDGNITINSTLNKGTEITITIPLEGGKYHE